MAQATPRLPLPVTQFQIVVLARWMAKKAIKEKLWRQHVKLSSIPARDISLAAHSYLAEHPELYAEAKVLAERISQVMHRKRMLDRARKSLCRTQVQNDRWLRQGEHRWPDP
jgi:hypothetical protein